MLYFKAKLIWNMVSKIKLGLDYSRKKKIRWNALIKNIKFRWHRSRSLCNEYDEKTYKIN